MQVQLPLAGVSPGGGAYGLDVVVAHADAVPAELVNVWRVDVRRAPEFFHAPRCVIAPPVVRLPTRLYDIVWSMYPVFSIRFLG